MWQSPCAAGKGDYTGPWPRGPTFSTHEFCKLSFSRGCRLQKGGKRRGQVLRTLASILVETSKDLEPHLTLTDRSVPASHSVVQWGFVVLGGRVGPPRSCAQSVWLFVFVSF